MKTPFNRLFFILIAFSLVTAGCDDDGTKTLISAYGKTKSHNAGDDCLDCHTKGGEGKGRFNAAGTVYEADLISPFPNTTVHVWSEPEATGDSITVIEVDGKGNFYTTEAIDWTGGRFLTVTSDTDTMHMTLPTTLGSCNGCHGASVARIFVGN